MFKFDGCMGRGRFLQAAALRLGLFIASVFAFPFLLMGLASASGCERIGGACGALGLVAATAFKPLAFILFVLSLIGISMRRTRDAGMPGLVGLIVPLLFSANYAFFVYVGAPWSFAFSAGVLFQAFPWAALLALYCIAILGVMPSRYHRDETANPFGTMGLIAFGLGSLIASSVTLGLGIAFAGIQPWTIELSRMLRTITRVTPYAMIAFAAALGWTAWQYRAAPDDAGGPPVSTSAAARVPPPPIWALFGVALVAALIACAASLGKEFSGMIPLTLVVNLGSMVLPTATIYFFLLLGLWLAAVRRSAASFGVLLLAFLPFVHWGYTHWSILKAHQRETATIEAIPTKAPVHLPTTLVFESRSVTGMRGVWKVSEIERTISKGAYGHELAQFDRGKLRTNAPARSMTASLPEEYLLLRVGHSSSFAKNGQNYATAGGPLELRYIDSSHDDLVAIWYREFNPSPSLLPVLTTSGWFRGSNSATTDEVDARVGEFLSTALKKPS
ncbi:MAG: hypothetical protein WCA28_33295 [Bradyrhizobium sp.]